MRIETSQISYATAHRSASAAMVIDETLRVSGPALDKVQLSGLAQSFSNSGSDDLSDLEPKDRLALLAIWALLGQKIRFHRFRPPGANGGAAGASGGVAATEVHRRIELRSEAEQTSLQARGVVAWSKPRTAAGFNSPRS
jgi:hypothetical protein